MWVRLVPNSRHMLKNRFCYSTDSSNRGSKKRSPSPPLANSSSQHNSPEARRKEKRKTDPSQTLVTLVHEPPSRQPLRRGRKVIARCVHRLHYRYKFLLCPVRLSAGMEARHNGNGLT